MIGWCIEFGVFMSNFCVKISLSNLGGEVNMKEQASYLFRNLSYKEAKQKIEDWINEMRAVEYKLAGKLIFENGYLSMDELRKKFEAVNNGNKEMLMLLQLFVSVFNEFGDDARWVIYHSFFQKRLNESIAQKLNFSLRTLERTKSKAVIKLAEAIELELLLSPFVA